MAADAEARYTRDEAIERVTDCLAASLRMMFGKASASTLRARSSGSGPR